MAARLPAGTVRTSSSLVGGVEADITSPRDKRLPCRVVHVLDQRHPDLRDGRRRQGSYQCRQGQKSTRRPEHPSSSLHGHSLQVLKARTVAG